MSFGRIVEIFYWAKTVFMRSAITPPKVNRFGWSLEHCELIVGSWSRQILGAIRAVATVWEAAEIVCKVNNARFYRFSIGQILRHLHNNVDRWSGKNFRNIILKILPQGVVRGYIKNAKIANKISRSCDFRPPSLRNDYRSPEIHYQSDPLPDV